MIEEKLAELGFNETHSQTVAAFLERGEGVILACGEDGSENLIESFMDLHEEISPKPGWGMYDMRPFNTAPSEKFNQAFRAALRTANRLMLFPLISTQDRAIGFSKIGDLGMLGAANIDAPTCQEVARQCCELEGFSSSTLILLTRRVPNPSDNKQIKRLAYSSFIARQPELLEKVETDDVNSLF
ncbi:MAG TPA: hypothetical protein PKE58_05070 [Acidobacteriota bacterium]|nr:hypothetical protein [Acidobacteriota bacterium]